MAISTLTSSGRRPAVSRDLRRVRHLGVATRDATVDELAQQVPLVRFAILTLARAGDLRVAGFRLEPTGRNPRHFTVALDDLEVLPGPVESHADLLTLA